jgi:hypothetical protein
MQGGRFFGFHVKETRRVYCDSSPPQVFPQILSVVPESASELFSEHHALMMTNLSNLTNQNRPISVLFLDIGNSFVLDCALSRNAPQLQHEVALQYFHARQGYSTIEVSFRTKESYPRLPTKTL